MALLDGVCMGGGNGLSMHGKFRVASENTVSFVTALTLKFCFLKG